MEIRFTFCFRLQYVKDPRHLPFDHLPFTISMTKAKCLTWKPEGLDLSAGPVPVFPSIWGLHKPESCSTFRKHSFANLAVPKSTSFVFCAYALQKGGVPAAPSGTATLLRLSPNHQFCLRPILAVTDFRHPRLSWLDGRCVQGPGTYSPRHG